MKGALNTDYILFGFKANRDETLESIYIFFLLQYSFFATFYSC